MGYAQTLQGRRFFFIKCTAAIAAIFLVTPACRAQAALVSQQPDASWSEYLNKYPGLLTELGRLVDKLQRNIQFPAARGESHILPLLPESTIFYAAYSNYGDAAHQVLKIFQQELQESPVLRNWWEHGEMATTGPKLEESLEQFYQLHQYLGEELVVSGSMEGREPSLLVVAEVRKPSLKKILQQMVEQAADKSKPGVRVLEPQELATAEDKKPGEDLVVLVRPDYAVAAVDVTTLRKFNARLDGRSREFVSSPFGQRVVQEYQGGVTVLGAADLHKILEQIPPGTEESQVTFQRSGFADMKYLIWEHKIVSGQTVSQGELSFNSPRHGPASWIGKPAPLGSLDFVSPRAVLAGTVVLTNLAQIFDDFKKLAGPSNAGTFAGLAQMEQGLKLSLKEDLLGHLGGEITAELDNPTASVPAWRAILSVKEAIRLQQTLDTLLAAVHFDVKTFEDGRITYYTVRIPSAKTATEIGYAFVDGYLIVASSREGVAEAVRLHASGGSVATSKKFLASLPPGHSSDASALFYQDPVAMTALQLRRIAPKMVESLAQVAGQAPPAVISVYGEESAIREASANSAYDAGAVLVLAAIAIPNLLRSRIAATKGLCTQSGHSWARSAQT